MKSKQTPREFQVFQCCKKTSAKVMAWPTPKNYLKMDISIKICTGLRKTVFIPTLGCNREWFYLLEKCLTGAATLLSCVANTDLHADSEIHFVPSVGLFCFNSVATLFTISL